jgi:hypothetical protein
VAAAGVRAICSRATNVFCVPPRRKKRLNIDASAVTPLSKKHKGTGSGP